MLATSHPIREPGNDSRLAYNIKSDNTPRHAQLNGVGVLDKIVT